MSFTQVYLLLLAVIIGGIVAGNFLIGTPYYLFDKFRSGRLEKLAKDFGLTYEANEDLWSFIPLFRFFYFGHPWRSGTIRRHHIAGKIGDVDVEIYDSENFVQTDFVGVYLNYNRRIHRTIVKVNGEIKENLTWQIQFTPVDQLRKVLQQFQDAAGRP
jgi:hypothetical protein